MNRIANKFANTAIKAAEQIEELVKLNNNGSCPNKIEETHCLLKNVGDALEEMVILFGDAVDLFGYTLAAIQAEKNQNQPDTEV